jgi:hypothetical protein
MVSVNHLCDYGRPMADQVCGLLGARAALLRIKTNECCSSRGIRSSPIPAALVTERNARRTLATSRSEPVRMQKTRLLSCRSSPALSRCASCLAWCSQGALAAPPGTSGPPESRAALDGSLQLMIQQADGRQRADQSISSGSFPIRLATSIA